MMHRVFLPLILVTLVPATLAQAGTVRPMEARPSFGQLQQTCMDMEGIFTTSPDGKGYACTTENCDGNGGSCTVACDNDQNCVGETPTRIEHPVSLRGILQDGNNIIRDMAPPQSSPSGSSMGGSGGPDFPDGPIL